MNVLEVQVPWWRKAWNDNPLKVILIIALVVRVLAALFSKGYAFHDDHFDVIRVAQDWVDGIPHWIADAIPPNHSMFYAGINALFIYILEAFGIHDPQYKMVFIRLVHALYSMLIVYYGYKITMRLSGNKDDAVIVGLMLSLLWFMPFLGVKNLVEMVCIPPLMAAFYKAIKAKVSTKDWLFIGLLVGLSFTFRYHVIIFAGGLGLLMLFRKQFIPGIIFSLGFIVSAFLVIGVIDVVFWEYPFQSIISYFQYNAENAYNYSTGPFYRFFLTVIGFTVLPVSLFLLVGYVKGWKISKELMLAATLFFLIHSIFPNKQERFIIPFFPFFIILGVIGWNQIVRKSNKYQIAIKGSWWFFWSLNIVATIALALTYSKKDRIEPLSYLSHQEDVQAVLIESSSNGIKHVPDFYLGGVAVEYSQLNETKFGLPAENAADAMVVIHTRPAWKSLEDVRKEYTDTGIKPNYVIFKRKEALEARKQEILELFENQRLVEMEKVTPSFFDLLLHKMNPRVHKEEVNYIYKLEPAI